MSIMENLKQLGIIPVDYALLSSIFSDYKYPRNKIANLEIEGKLIRLKRSLYVVSPDVSGKLLSTELIANHIYGPSYISMESALRYYGLIPESVRMVRSMTTKRSRIFKNAISRFDYINCSEEYYPIGINQKIGDDYSFLIASPEKALCDLIAYTPKVSPRFINAMLLYLEEDIRLDMESFYKMEVNIFRQCAEVSKKKNDLNNLIKLLQR
jgi:predicted transcriptional regulator of viral defense system